MPEVKMHRKSFSILYIFLSLQAIQAYQEALKRGPPAVNPEAYKLYSNVAASYTKLGAYPEGIKVSSESTAA